MPRPSPVPLRHVDDAERRARLATRHALVPGRRAADVVAATEAMTVLHATDNATVYLSAHARVEDLSVADVDRALYDDRSVVKQMAMRRTIFGFPRSLLAAGRATVRARLAGPHGTRLCKEAVAAGLADDTDAASRWLERARQAVAARLAGGDELTTAELIAEVPELAGKVTFGADRSWSGTSPIAGLVLVQMWAEGSVTRGVNRGGWWTSRPTWTAAATWLGESPPEPEPDAAYAALIGRWLHTFGPGTVDDLVWWLGATKGIVRTALESLGAVAVTLDGLRTGADDGELGWLLPDDVAPVQSDAGDWAALLPILDPTTMGWKHRHFYLGEHQPLLFDAVGNGGNTAWWNGEIAGTWVQDSAGRVHVVPVTELTADAHRLLATEAERLTAWLEGRRVGNTYPSVLMQRARAELDAGR